MSHEYNIIAKSGKGNIKGKEYTFRYQVDNDAEVYETTLYCRGAIDRMGIFSWIEGKPTPLIETAEDKVRFVENITDYQKGRSYRLTHPIIKSDREKLSERVDDLYKELESARYRLRQFDDKLYKEKQTKYLESLPKNILDCSNAISKVLNVCESYLDRSPVRSSLMTDVWYIYDAETRKPTSKLVYDRLNKKYHSEPISEDDLIILCVKFN